MIRFRMLLLMILFSLCPFRVAAQQDGLASLQVCNKGSLAVDVATALSTTDILLRKNWEVKGWTRIPPGSCESVYSENTNDPAYIAFGFAGSTGARHAAQVEPKDHEKNYWGRPVFSKADKKFCVRADQFAYRSYNADPGSDCETLHVSSSDKGQYFSFPAALYFQPDGQTCYDNLPDVVRIESGSCAGGDYSLDILPNARDQVIAARSGSSTDKDQSSAEPSIGDQLMNELGKAAAERRKRREEMQAEEAVQEEARAGARVRQNVCISDDLTKEWRNPSAGGKMENLKRLLVQSLRERANTPGYDQTRWIVVDSRYYSAWPNTSWGKLVSTIPGGSCGAAGHREILELAP